MIDKNFEIFVNNNSNNNSKIDAIASIHPQNKDLKYILFLVMYVKSLNTNLYDYLQGINTQATKLCKERKEEFKIVHFERENIKDGVISIMYGNNKISASIENYIFKLIVGDMAFKNISCIKNEIDSFENKAIKDIEVTNTVNKELFSMLWNKLKIDGTDVNIRGFLNSDSCIKNSIDANNIQSLYEFFIGLNNLLVTRSLEDLQVNSNEYIKLLSDKIEPTCHNKFNTMEYAKKAVSFIINKKTIESLTDIKYWLPWAYANGIHPYIIAFVLYTEGAVLSEEKDFREQLNVKQNELDGRNPMRMTQLESIKARNNDKEVEDGYLKIRGHEFASPDGLKNLDTILNKNRPKEKFEIEVEKTIGKKYRPKFLNFISFNNSSKYDINKIMDGKENYPNNDNMLREELSYLISQSLIRKMQNYINRVTKETNGNLKKEHYEKLANPIKWILTLPDKSLVLNTMSCLVKDVPEISKTGILYTNEFSNVCPEFNEFLDENSSLLYNMIIN